MKGGGWTTMGRVAARRRYACNVLISVREEIELLRAELVAASMRHGLRDDRVLALSEELDALLVVYQRSWVS